MGYVAYEAVKNYIGKTPAIPSVFGCYSGYFVYDHYLRKLFSVNVENAEKIVEKARRAEVERAKGSSSILKAGSREKFEKMVERGRSRFLRERFTRSSFRGSMLLTPT